MKYAAEWFEELEEPHRSQALENLTNISQKYPSACLAVIGGFEWNETPEGHEYWHDLFTKLGGVLP